MSAAASQLPATVSDAAHCPHCAKRFGPEAVATDAAEWSDAEQTWIAARRFWCDHCDHLVVWSQLARGDGGLFYPPVLVSGPAIVRSRQRIAQHLRRHGRQIGVVQR